MSTAVPAAFIIETYNKPMNQQLLIGTAAGLIVGGIAGYFFGSYQAVQSIKDQTGAQERVKVETSVNPLESVKTNPYENVKTNPFE